MNTMWWAILSLQVGGLMVHIIALSRLDFGLDPLVALKCRALFERPVR